MFRDLLFLYTHNCLKQTYDFIPDGFSYGVACVDLCICNMLVLGLYIYIRSPAEIVGSNPAEGMDICLFRVLCVVR